MLTVEDLTGGTLAIVMDVGHRSESQNDRIRPLISEQISSALIWKGNDVIWISARPRTGAY